METIIFCGCNRVGFVDWMIPKSTELLHTLQVQ